MQIQHNGYFNVTNGKKIIKDFFHNLGYKDSIDTPSDNPFYKERIDITVGDGFFGVEFRKDDLQISDRCIDVEKTELINKLEELGKDGVLISLVFDNLQNFSTDYEYIGIRHQDEKLIIVNFRKGELRGYITIQKSTSMIALSYQQLKEGDETTEEKNIKQDLSLAATEVNNTLMSR